MRLGRTAFWRLFAINIAVAAVLVALLPADIGLYLPPVEGIPMPLPLKWVAAYFACLPIGWLGSQRLHDVGKTGWHAWLPLLGFACVSFGADLLRPFLLQTLIWAQANPGIVRDRHLGMAVMIGLWLGALLLAAGTLRASFYWLQPGDSGDNRYGPPPEGAAPPVVASAPVRGSGPLAGRLGRLPFFLLLGADVALVYGVNYVTNTVPGMKPPGAVLPGLLSILLYLPAFLAAVPRLHDRGQTALLPVLVLLGGAAATIAEHWLDQSQTNWVNIAVNIATFFLLFQCWQPGEADDNRYGPPPGQEPLPGAPEPPPARAAAASPARQAAPRPTARPMAKQGFGKRGL